MSERQQDRAARAQRAWPACRARGGFTRGAPGGGTGLARAAAGAIAHRGQGSPAAVAATDSFPQAGGLTQENA